MMAAGGQGQKKYLPCPALFFYVRYTDMFNFSLRPGMSFILGKPGSGKTTTLSACAYFAQKNNIRVFSNVPILGTEILKPSEMFGKVDLSRSMLILDEAQLFYDNRKWKTNFNDDDMFDFISKFRHYEISYFILASQGKRIDPKLIDLFNTVYLLHPLPFHFVQYDIYDQDITTDDNGQFIHAYYKMNKHIRFFNGAPYYHMFDTHDKKELPPTPYNPWTNEMIFKDYVDPYTIISERIKDLYHSDIYETIKIYG